MDLPGRVSAVVGCLCQAAEKVEDPMDMIVVQMGDYRHFDWQRVLQAARVLYRAQPRFQCCPVDAGGATVADGKLRVLWRPKVQQERVAVPRIQSFHRHDHSRALIQTDWIARKTSTMPLPWKYRSRPRSVLVEQRISLMRSGCPSSSR